MKRLLLCLTTVFITLTSVAADDLTTRQPDPHLARARKILKEVPLIDGHNDLAWKYRDDFGGHMESLDLRGDTSNLPKPLHTDIPRLKAGGIGGQFWSVYVPADLKGDEAVRATLEQIDTVDRFVEKYPDVFERAWSAADIRRIHKKGKIASLVGMEGGHSINNSLGVLRRMYQLGARYMTLTHSKVNDWADSGTDAPKHGGLSPFGMEVVREMNRLGMLVDLSHVSPETMHDALDVSVAPVIFSHSSARAVVDHPRNVPDDVLQRLKANRGIIMVTFVGSFVSADVRAYVAAQDAEKARLKTLYPGDPKRADAELEIWKKDHPAPRASLAQVADHIDHIRRTIGSDFIGIGGDLDGITTPPIGLESVAEYPALLAELLRRGYSEEEVKKIAGLNLLRVFEEVEAVSARLRRERAPSDKLITDF